ncbi:glycosyltransferase family 4 protein [Tunicatimonas pelagia]|uniref:glycosyltransferase family 4 protein n=1 Tax=Tunicatimonas pelagia TaxID=931531 RepID=UPI002664EBA6|nr:glycosyltransferase [Tunicatimonas pelagia]WKN41970.1 glycosyltransferase [Tunicatimonas pelagia]
MKLLFTDFDIPYLLNDTEYAVGGACVRQYTFGKALYALGHTVGFLTWKGANRYVDQADHPFDLVETYRKEGGISGLRYFYERLPSVIRAIRAYQPDFVFHITSSFNVGTWALLCKVLGIPFVYLVANDIDCDDRIKKRLSTREWVFFRLGLKHARLIVCQNNYQLSQLQHRYPGKECIVLHNPYHQLDESIGKVPGKDREYIAWVGRFCRQKNMNALYEVARSLPHQTFKIAGKNDHPDAETQAVLDKLKSCKNVVFVGYLKRQEIAYFLSKAYAVLNTSLYEGFSNVFLEALSVGTPIVTRQVTDPDGIIAHHNLGRAVEEYQELSGAVSEVVNHSAYDVLSKRCIAYVAKYHNAQYLANKMSSKLAEILDREKVI